MQIAGTEVVGLSGPGLRGGHVPLGGIRRDAEVVQGVLAAGDAEGTVDVLKVQEAPAMEEIPQAHIGFPLGVVPEEAEVPAPLPRQEGGQVGAAGGDADAVVKADALVQAAIQDPGGIHPPEPAAHVDETSFHSASSRDSSSCQEAYPTESGSVNGQMGKIAQGSGPAGETGRSFPAGDGRTGLALREHRNRLAHPAAGCAWGAAGCGRPALPVFT